MGHHGARRGSGRPWLRAVLPDLALISVGRRNRFGHPSAEVLARLRRARVEVRAQGRDDCIELVCRRERFESASGCGKTPASRERWVVVGPA